MFGFTLPEVIMFTIVIVISLVIHEFSHGLVSYLQGDNTAKDEGRLTLNPISHIDPFGLIAIYLVHFGWAKPIPTNPSFYKNRRLGIILTSLAGPMSNLLLAFLGAVIYVKIDPQSEIVVYFFVNLIQINIILAVFNSFPIPPLDGSKILGEIFGGKIRELVYRFNQIGMFVVFLLFYIPFVSTIFSNIIRSMFYEIIKIASLIV